MPYPLEWVCFSPIALLKEQWRKKYVLNIGMAGINQASLLILTPTSLYPDVYRGKLVYRAKGSSKKEQL